ncbi:M20 family metallopeptidase [Desulfosporosinus metallidurans]|uniref:Peptidase M20 domain-containing protein 2 n=1 Tax=Desulfosporosinus metallidurans TaxID=1888891 RepID=A0A1Q8QYD5_9FIRM|nr:M20 family metallopeptidase [Desulfosporosinus metallidurans]OLN32369.1 Catalyzes the cleavage of p-aminobenzoyl-glutamate to p-aminobenzoate and glutamate, subunit A [Desulfosporosinus metallidurans]
MDAIKGFFIAQAQHLREEVWEVARQIGEHPELGYKEYFASNVLCGFLQKHGFEVIRSIAGVETAFLARFKGTRPGPKISFLAEYDALPDVGHGCGHNLIGAASAGAAVILSKSLELSGEVLVIGSPAEETSGAKVTLVEKGIFEDVDAAIMFHPGSQNVPIISSLALDALEFTFHGRAAHAVAASYFGVNALDAMINFFVGINALKKQIPQDMKINGIITEGGTVPNIVPERAVARFYVRARRRKDLDELREQVIRCAEGAASMVSAKMTWQKFEFSYDEMHTNLSLAECFTKNLQEMGINQIAPPQTAMGSVDMGNVSRAVPAIHPYLTLGTGTEIPHTRDFAQATLSPDGEELVMLAMQTLALTGWDVINDKKLLQKIKREFRLRK